MKKLLLLLAIFTTFVNYAQKIKADVLILKGSVTTAIRDSYNIPTGEHWIIFNSTTNQTEIGDDNENWVTFGGSSTTPTLQQVTTQGATTSNNITIANNDYPRLIIQNTLTNNYATYWDNSIVYSYPGGHNLSLLKPASFTGNYSLSIPAITANDTIALKSELVGLGSAYARLDTNNTFTSNNTFNNGANTNPNITSSNSDGNIGFYSTNTSTGNGIYSYNSSSGNGIYSANLTSGNGIYSLSSGTGNGIVSNVSSGGSGFSYVGQNNGINSFTVTKQGVVTASAFVGDGSGLTNLPSGSSFDPSSNQTITGNWSFTGGTIEVPTPTTSNQAVNKAMLDAATTRIGDLEASQYVQNDDINTLQLEVAALEAINKAPLTITYSASMSDAYTRLQPNRVVTMAGNGTLVITGTLAAGDTGMLEVKGTGNLTLTNSDTSTKLVSAPTLVWFIVNASGNLVWYTDEGGETINIVSQTGDGNTTIDWETSVWQKFNFGAQNDVLIFGAPSTPKDLLTLEIKQDAVGSRTLIWGNDILAVGGIMPTLSLGANDVDVIHFSYDGTNYKLLEDYLDFQLVATTFDGVAPTAPTNLSALTVGVTTIDLEWDAATDNVAVTGYKVYQNGVLIATLGNVLTYYVEGLTEATTYIFEVSALDALGNESALSVPLIQTTATETPTYGTIISSGMNASYPAVNAFDGNINTFTITTSPSGTYIGQDFGTAVTVYKIRLLPAQTIGSNTPLRLNNTRIEWSNDNVTWNLFERVEPGTITSLNYTNWLEYLAAGFDGGAAITARYFRIINYDASTYGGSPAEIEFYTE